MKEENKQAINKETSKETRKVNLDTMVGMGIKKNIAGREYTILPVTIQDMVYIIGENEEEKLVIVDKKKIEKNDEWHIFGLNITNETRRKIFFNIVEKYVFYKDHPMTEELLIEHNWSFKEIGEFLNIWCQLSD